MNNFKYCVNCGSNNIKIENNNKVSCSDCGFDYYHGVRTAAVAVLKFNDKIVFSVRNINPKKGYLDLIGGFVDAGESLEEALIRECKEELNIVIFKDDLKYLTSINNLYGFYNVCDVFYEVNLSEFNPVLNTNEIKSLILIGRDEIEIDKLAFDSQKNFFRNFYNV